MTGAGGLVWSLPGRGERGLEKVRRENDGRSEGEKKNRTAHLHARHLMFRQAGRQLLYRVAHRVRHECCVATDGCLTPMGSDGTA